MNRVLKALFVASLIPMTANLLWMSWQTYIGHVSGLGALGLDILFDYLKFFVYALFGHFLMSKTNIKDAYIYCLIMFMLVFAVNMLGVNLSDYPEYTDTGFKIYNIYNNHTFRLTLVGMLYVGGSPFMSAIVYTVAFYVFWRMSKLYTSKNPE